MSVQSFSKQYAKFKMPEKLFLGVILFIHIASLAYPKLDLFYKLQYQQNNLYTSGLNDLFLVFYLSNIWLATRSLIMNINFNVGKKEQRFKEQLYQGIMYSATFIFGVYNYMNSDYKDNWTVTVKDYPHVYVTFEVKLYYLLILSMWLHMIFVLMIEKRRKDHVMMLAHHAATISLVAISWFTHLHKIGLLIEMLFDSTDIILCFAKCVKYTNRHKLADYMFTAFVLNWVFTRQYLFASIILIWTQFPKYNEFKWDVEAGYFVSETVYYTCLSLLVLLFVLAMLWFGLIIKLIIKMLSGNNVDDDRSDGEDEDSKEKES
eukprot:NODE_842_length_3766_cov_0.367603.p1 type:complete len:319 gc:universal NODE_842_length_3766_cov_0.367603:1665-2621(+)